MKTSRYLEVVARQENGQPSCLKIPRVGVIWTGQICALSESEFLAIRNKIPPQTLGLDGKPVHSWREIDKSEYQKRMAEAEKEKEASQKSTGPNELACTFATSFNDDEGQRKDYTRGQIIPKKDFNKTMILFYSIPVCPQGSEIPIFINATLWRDAETIRQKLFQKTGINFSEFVEEVTKESLEDMTLEQKAELQKRMDQAVNFLSKETGQKFFRNGDNFRPDSGDTLGEVRRK